MTISVHPIASTSDPRFAGLFELYCQDYAERDPEDPPITAEYAAAELFGLPADRPRVLFVAERDGRVVGYGHATDTDDDAEARVKLTELELYTAADERRRGVATALMGPLVRSLVERGRDSAIGWPCTDVSGKAGRALCERYGMTERQEERCSRMATADVDQELLDEWIAAAPAAAPGYRLESWEGPCPDHLIGAWCEAAAAMEEVPLDDIDYDFHTRDVDAQREADRAFAERGFRIHRTLALGPDGDPAGLTALYVHETRPEIGQQDDTGVLPAHRGHRLGRWLKAVNHRRVTAAHPEMTVIETYNAQTNPWMLDINVAMGFRPHHVYTAYQGTVADALRAVERPA